VRPDEEQNQQQLHEAIESALSEAGELDEGEVLTGWIVIHETATLSSGKAGCGHFYGPREMTTWRALGLVDWVRNFCLSPGDD
jgi:hypothetical protein